MSKTKMAMRRSAQLFVTSRAGLRRPGLFANSIPKSGTHLVKAILEGAGYTFAGHYGDTELGRLRMRETSKAVFATGHVSQPVKGLGIRLLVYRDPADVALSMALYIRTRADHPRHKLFSKMELAQSVTAIFDGVADLEPLAERYGVMRDWARASQARLIDFSEVRDEPASLLARVEAPDTDLEIIARHISRWNPTKRTRKDPQEQALKEALRASDALAVRKTFDVYQEIKSSPQT